MIEKPADIIHHIIGEELDTTDLSFDSEGKQAAINAHSGWRMAFTVNKKINSKKLIEGIAKESKLFPFFKGNELSFNSLKETYNEADITPPNGFIIKDSDVISYKFDRTKIEDIKTKVVLNYHLDYAEDDFKKSTESNTEADTASEFFTQTEEGYSNSYYGIEGEQGDDPIEVKYIRDNETAEKLQRFFLAWYCNQHNICKIKLPLSYLYAEIGDIVAFPTLLGGDRKAYGEDYSLEGLSVYGATIRNGQEIFPYWMVMGVNKTLEYVEIDLIQMHNLVDEITNIAPIANAGVDQVGFENEIITLDGTGSYDPDGDELTTYSWTGTTALSGADTPTPSFTISISEPATHSFELIVNDGEFDSLPDSCNVFVNPLWQAVRGIAAEGFEFFQLWWDNNSPYPSGTNGFYVFASIWRSSAAAAGNGIVISNPNNSNWRWGVEGEEFTPYWLHVLRSEGGGDAVILWNRNTDFGIDYSGYNELIISLDEHYYDPGDPNSTVWRNANFYIEDELTQTKIYFPVQQESLYDTPPEPWEEWQYVEPVQELIGISDITAEAGDDDVS